MPDRDPVPVEGKVALFRCEYGHTNTSSLAPGDSGPRQCVTERCQERVSLVDYAPVSQGQLPAGEEHDQAVEILLDLVFNEDFPPTFEKVKAAAQRVVDARIDFDSSPREPGLTLSDEALADAILRAEWEHPVTGDTREPRTVSSMGGVGRKRWLAIAATLRSYLDSLSESETRDGS